ncbi:hypothetical protein B6I21_03135 [candidate division KSB1 bacterium 4572_119]|nr:MAG: hypothetical protein B6I21_03135 [candidate division KSB1 bacterium 4572_119]
MKKGKTLKLQQILDTAHDLFFRFGFKRVSIEEICRTAKVSKMTFYKHFKNKNELVKFLMNEIYNQSFKEYYEIMDQDISYAKKTEQVIHWKLANQEKLSHEFIKEYLDSSDPEIKLFFLEKQKEVVNKIVDDYKKAQKNGDIRPDIKPEFILYILPKLTEIYKDEDLLKMYNTPKDLTKEVINFFFYGILEKK